MKKYPPSAIIDREEKRLAMLPAPSGPVDGYEVNPTLSLSPLEDGGLLIACRTPSGETLIRDAQPADLAALKIVAEDIDPWQAAREHGISLAAIDHVLEHARACGIVLAPHPLIQRPEDWFTDGFPATFRRPAVFTLQWHITQACDLHCRHCYDRSARRQVKGEDGEMILTRFRRFCDSHNVRGQVSFSGGNPLMHPDFFHFLRLARDLGLVTAILGNPCGEKELDRILAAAPPAFYQISLEGLEQANDRIRGRGHFRRSLAFLDLLGEKGIYRMVMLTLHRDNQDQLIPLTEELSGRCELFTFNRLCRTGEGEGLAGADREGYPELLRSYLEASRRLAHVAIKDNLFNIVLEREGRDLFGGCTGFGCGAAFNFLALLPDGEVHACRKFPSPLGSIHEAGLEEIYHSPAARAFRNGPEECRGCRLRPVCRGCPAVAMGDGLDPAKQRDRYCFLPSPPPGGRTM